jgi:hypothetical protein
MPRRLTLRQVNEPQVVEAGKKEGGKSQGPPPVSREIAKPPREVEGSFDRDDGRTGPPSH